MLRSIFFLSRFHSEVIRFFSVNPSTYRSPYSTSIAGIYKHSAIPKLSLNTKCQYVLVLYTQGYNGQRSDAPELMLNINMEGFQGLFPTHPIIFSCVPKLLAQHKGRHSCALELLTQHKSSITQVLQSSLLNTKHLINHVLQGPCPTQTSIYIYHQ